ncbi:hypothetical protein BGHDH14_bgh04759 [Blumeria hordei DH14]|uniref:CCHC-type domain-containing protein n=1 Tax=Blumeria graminis f. sp. hordei (strain DH14) TaxID=546991 RepID=N1JIX6_BLUG1|nr:hypothetical protein BGHDH14_bgh04759 [Blumeria hordei DH14]
MSSNRKENEKRDPLDQMTSKFERLGGSWNNDKLKIFEKDTAKFFSYISDLLSDKDQSVFDEFDNAIDVWNFLKDKYNKISESTTSNFMSKIQSFPNQFEMEEKGIHSAWETLKGYRRKLIAADESFRFAYPDKTLFLILGKTLPPKYSSILDSFRGNKWTVEEKLNILIEKEEDSRDHEIEHPAFDRRHHQRQRRNSVITMENTPDAFVEMRCYKCHGSNHISRNCPYAKAALEYAITLRDKDEKRADKKGTTKLRSKKASKPEKKKTTHKRTRSTPNGRHGYAAYEETSDSTSHNSTSEDSPEEESESDSDFHKPQKVMLTKELISKSTPAAWVLDTGATFPMTDQIHLFRGKLKNIHPITIQVGGGTLTSSHRGTVVVKCADGLWGIAENVFYVPNLGVNLLSAKRLCRTGMEGHFDEKNVWIKDENKTMIHAVQSDGLYIVKHIATELRGKPLDTRVTKQVACPATHRAPDNNLPATHLKTSLNYYRNTSIKCSDNPDFSDKDPDQSDDDLAETKEERARYRLMHPRFGHYSPNIISKLHKTSNIDRVKIL